MILSNTPEKTDLEDAGVLFDALMRYAGENADRLDLSVVAIGYGTLLERSMQAAEVIAQHAPQTVTDGEWDGCVWMERLESISPDSLAAQLYQETVDTGAVVKRWLERFI